jgi:hypothetical protein
MEPADRRTVLQPLRTAPARQSAELRIISTHASLGDAILSGADVGAATLFGPVYVDAAALPNSSSPAIDAYESLFDVPAGQVPATFNLGSRDVRKMNLSSLLLQRGFPAEDRFRRALIELGDLFDDALFVQSPKQLDKRSRKMANGWMSSLLNVKNTKDAERLLRTVDSLADLREGISSHSGSLSAFRSKVLDLASTAPDLAEGTAVELEIGAFLARFYEPLILDPLDDMVRGKPSKTPDFYFETESGLGVYCDATCIELEVSTSRAKLQKEMERRLHAKMGEKFRILEVTLPYIASSRDVALLTADEVLSVIAKNFEGNIQVDLPYGTASIRWSSMLLVDTVSTPFQQLSKANRHKAGFSMGFGWVMLVDSPTLDEAEVIEDKFRKSLTNKLATKKPQFAFVPPTAAKTVALHHLAADLDWDWAQIAEDTFAKPDHQWVDALFVYGRPDAAQNENTSSLTYFVNPNSAHRAALENLDRPSRTSMR